MNRFEKRSKDLKKKKTLLITFFFYLFRKTALQGLFLIGKTKELEKKYGACLTRLMG